MAARKLKRTPRSLLYDNDSLFNEKDEFIDFEPVLRPTMFWNPLTRAIPQVFSEDGDALKVEKASDRSAEELNDEVVAGDVAVALPLVGGLYEIYSIVGSGTMDANVAARTIRVAIEDALPSPAAASARSMETSELALAAGGTFQFVMPPRPYHYTNLNGVFAIVADENPLPYVCMAPVDIILENNAANWEVGDTMGISVRFRRVGGP